jgi:hypothetical protein
VTPLELVAGAAGASLLLLALLWQRARRRKVVRTLRRALVDDDPDVRRGAIVVTAQQGLSDQAGLLLELARRERDPSVSLVLAQAVARNQWEPATGDRMIALRLWAQRRLAHEEPLREEDRERARGVVSEIDRAVQDAFAFHGATRSRGAVHPPARAAALPAGRYIIEERDDGAPGLVSTGEPGFPLDPLVSNFGSRPMPTRWRKIFRRVLVEALCLALLVGGTWALGPDAGGSSLSGRVAFQGVSIPFE